MHHVKVLQEYPDMREKLYSYGFLFTDAEIDCQLYPFYGLWKSVKFKQYQLLVSYKQNYKIAENEQHTMVLVGHAYNPYTMQYDEEEILNDLLTSLMKSNEAFFDKLNELTGIFTLIWFDENSCCFVGDATCMQNIFYTIHEQKLYIATHTNLLGELLSLQWDDYVKRLSTYRFFKFFGNYLPGDLTQYTEVKRMVPNHYAVVKDKTVEVKRFYLPAKQPKTEEEIVDEVAGLLNNNLALISKKWERPAISMTGGCDSKTTLSCATGMLDAFQYFSYISSEAEKVDAEAARKICDALQIPHKTYFVPFEDKQCERIEETRSIMTWNTGNILPHNCNDVRKRSFFSKIDDFDVEIKSWASEIGRAYYSKRFNGRTNFGKNPTPRACTTLYKVFLHNRALVRETDAVFAEYLNKYFERAEKNPIEWQEQFFWEFRVASWNGLTITGEHRYSFDITIPYNNRHLLALLLSAPIDVRISDGIYTKIRHKMNPIIDNTGVSVTNIKHTKKREKLENWYYAIHTKMF